MKRRSFIRNIALGSLILGAGTLPLTALAGDEQVKLTILHTNDQHSRIDPFPAGSRYAGQGGFARRASLINTIRQQEKHVLLLDSGDIFQGTPYFNYYGGELEFKLMSRMGYDAATLGNHDFDAGLEGLHQQLPHAAFPFVNCNYDFSNTILENHEKIVPFKIIEKGPLKIGIVGVGIELEGLVPGKFFGNTAYIEPIAEANRQAKHLKDQGCHLVICLSHLGYRYKSDKVSDIILAQNSEDIDIILGGHTHTFLEQPDSVTNKAGKAVIINQVGWAGLLLGRIDVGFSALKEKKEVFSSTVKVK